MRARTLAALALLALLAPAAASAGARVVLVNLNAPGVGYNDPTPTSPVGGNPGTTLGQQRLNAVQHALDIWGASLDSSVEIRVQSAFTTRTCNATSAVLASAGATTVNRDFPGAEFPETWYGEALANKRAGADTCDPAVEAGCPPGDIQALFNVNLGQPTCLAGPGWYYGLDAAEPDGAVDLVAVALHEVAHGLGFQSFANVSTGAKFLGLWDVYSRYYYDNTRAAFRIDLPTDEDVRLSAINARNVVWAGPRVTAAAPAVLSPGTPLVRFEGPAVVAGSYPYGEASFGPRITGSGLSGIVAAALDAVPPASDACTPIVNPDAVAGKIALVDRGTCPFALKVKYAQEAGAVAVIVADNAVGDPPAPLGGADPTITIPSIRISLQVGTNLKAALAAGEVRATIGLDETVLAGADAAGRALLNSPNPVVPGSSISHWDPVAFPNQLMEPAINQDLTHSVAPPEDLTLPLFRDIGWYLDRDLDRVDDEGMDMCLGSDLRDTVFVGAGDTGVPNTLFSNGCTVADYLNACQASAATHGDYASCAAAVTNAIRDAGFITGGQKGVIESAVARNK